MTESSNAGDILALTTEIVAAHVSNNTVSVGDLPHLINQVYQSLSTIGTGTVPVVERPQPAVSVKKSITPDYIICLEDGKQFKSLKRHLRTQYGLSPEQYREKWNLGADYPMVAPNYAAARSKLAKQMGLGQQRKKRR